MDMLLWIIWEGAKSNKTGVLVRGRRGIIWYRKMRREYNDEKPCTVKMKTKVYSWALIAEKDKEMDFP